MKIKEITNEAATDAKIVANDGKTITIAMPDGTQIQKPVATAIAQDQQGQTVFNLTSQPGQTANAAQQQSQQKLTPGATIPVNTDPNATKPVQTMGTATATQKTLETGDDKEIELKKIRRLSGL